MKTIHNCKKKTSYKINKKKTNYKKIITKTKLQQKKECKSKKKLDYSKILKKRSGKHFQAKCAFKMTIHSKQATNETN